MRTWTTEEKTTLLALRRQGKSGGAIADIMKKTRNAVMGQMHRLGLCQPKIAEKAAKQAIVTVVNGHKSISVRLMQPRLASHSRSEDNHFGISLMALQPNSCRWPYGEKDYLFCGKSKAPNSSYCPYHTQKSRRQSHEQN